MPNFYDTIDLQWDSNGDFIIDEDGDLKDTADDTIASFVAEVKSILASDYADWQKHPGYCSSLKDFIGEPNRPEIAKKIEGRIISALVSNRVAKQEDIKARVIPIRHDAIMVVLTLQVVPLSSNSVGDSGTVTLAFTFNLTTGNVYMISPEDDKKRSLNLVPVRGF